MDGEDADDILALELEDTERKLLFWGIGGWCGPARCTEEMAVAMGFRSIDDLFADGERLCEALQRREPLSRLDWCRIMLATEIGFASDLVGSGRDFEILSGVPDLTLFETLRGLQRKVTRELRGLLGHGLGTRPVRPAGESDDDGFEEG